MLNRLAPDLPRQGIPEIAINPVEHIYTVFSRVAEGRFRVAHHCAAHVEGDAVLDDSDRAATVKKRLHRIQ